LILSGGVSAGQRDLVPKVLADAGVDGHFHKVAMKPGKPVFFGTRGETLVFGLPGNPVSSMACFELFVRPALRQMAGHEKPRPNLVEACLTADFPYRTDRPTYHPAWMIRGGRGYEVRLIQWFGSPDLRALTSANALAVLPTGDHVHRAGHWLPVMDLDEP
jgi:molybdopterin molybdotransferase